MPPDGYKGRPLSDDQEKFLKLVRAKNFTTDVTGRKQGVIRIKKGARDYGYINSVVIQKHGIIGYRFELCGGNEDAVPDELVRLVELLSALYPDEWFCHPGYGDREKKQFLIVKSLRLAEKILEI